MLAACVLNAIVGAGFYHAHQLDPRASPTAGIFLRILANFACLLVPLAQGRALPRLHPWRGHRCLWLWGLFGVLCTSTYFLAVPLVGAGLTMFLSAGSGIVVAALSPILCGQRTRRVHYLGAAGSFVGLSFLVPAGGGGSLLGAVLAVFSGLAGGLALLMVARVRSAHRPETVMLHWTTANLLACGGFLFFFPPLWPTRPEAWAAYISAGLCAAASQYLTTLAYQKAPAPLLACLCYLSPVLGILADSVLFGMNLSTTAWIGVATVLFFGLALPLLKGPGETCGHTRAP